MHSEDWASREPPGVKPVSGIHPWRYIVAAVLLIGLVLAAFLVPLSMYYIYLPGPASDVESLLHVSGAKTYSSEGSLFLTTVTVDTEVTLADLVQAAIDSQKAVVDAKSLTQGGSLKDLEHAQQLQMKSSQVHAEEVAMSALGVAFGTGVRIVGTVADSPAHGVLHEGQRLVSLNGQKVSTTCDVAHVMSDVSPGETVNVVVARGGHRIAHRLKTVRNPTGASAFIGISMTDFVLPSNDVSVDFDTGEIGGPSAGLMFSLGLYDRLTPDDLTSGKQIAGTGEIDCNGDVLPIGGIEEKVAGAEREGAEIFLAPEQDAAAAEAAAHDVTVVPVGTFQDAADYLEGRE